MNPAPIAPDPLRAVTCERLRLLSIGYYISGALGALMVSLFFFTRIILGSTA